MEIKLKTKRKVYGVGINDADYQISWKVVVDGKVKRAMCHFYQTWCSMLCRVHSKHYHKRHPTYIGSSVCKDWIYFSNFKAWMETQDWEGKQLDKDLLVPGNKVYSPETCVFIDRSLNLFMTECDASRGKHPLGVSWDKLSNKYKAECSNPFTKKREHLGVFNDADEAHAAWRKHKHYLACKLADLEEDSRVKYALRIRYYKEEEISNE